MKILRLCVSLIFIVVLTCFIVFRFQMRSMDMTYPVITVDGDMLHVSLDASDEELLSGVTAYDEKDGDLTHKLIIESISRFTDPGVSIVRYAVCDNDNHAVTASRKITYTNYTPPKFVLKDSLVFGVSQNINIRDILCAYDLIDGDISSKVIITANEYTSNVVGVYHILAKVTNSKGDMISLQLPVYVEEKSLSAPRIELSDYLVYLKCGEAYDPAANIISAVDSSNKNLSALVQIDTNLDTSVPGMYEAHYRVSDAFGRIGHKILTLIVE